VVWIAERPCTLGVRGFFRVERRGDADKSARVWRLPALIFLLLLAHLIGILTGLLGKWRPAALAILRRKQRKARRFGLFFSLRLRGT
jgi:hypothetical protein